MINSIQIWIVVSQIFIQTETGIYQERFNPPTRMSMQQIEQKVIEMSGSPSFDWEQLRLTMPLEGTLEIGSSDSDEESLVIRHAYPGPGNNSDCENL